MMKNIEGQKTSGKIESLGKLESCLLVSWWVGVRSEENTRLMKKYIRILEVSCYRTQMQFVRIRKKEKSDRK